MAAGAINELGALDIFWLSVIAPPPWGETGLQLPFGAMQVHSTSLAVIEASAVRGGGVWMEGNIERDEMCQPLLEMFW